jgi:thiamine-phosphate pyrophosphorylase
MIDKLHYISQKAEDGSHLTAIKKALDAGCKWIQLRIKEEPNDLILEYAVTANQLCVSYGAKLIVNDHANIALKAGAYGVHLGLQDMSIKEARKIVGTQMVIGATANTLEHIEQRAAEGADYIGLGPFRFTTTKQNLSPFLGLQGFELILRQMRALRIHTPVIAIGGILPVDIDALMQAGIHGVAMSGAITHAENRKLIVENLYQQLNKNITKQPV